MPFSASPDPKAVKEGARVYLMTARAIETLGVKLAAGRTFSPESVAPPTADFGAALQQWAPEVVITQALANRLFPKGDALGKPLYIGLVNKSAKIVGIVQTLQAAPISGPFEKFGNQVVVAPITPAGPNALYVVRTQPGRRSQLMAQVEKEMADRVPGRYIEQLQTLTKTASDTRNGMRTGRSFWVSSLCWYLPSARSESSVSQCSTSLHARSKSAHAGRSARDASTYCAISWSRTGS